MRSAFALSVAALAGVALAAPHYGQPKEDAKNYHLVVETVVQTVYVTEPYAASKPTPSPKPDYKAPTVTTAGHKHKHAKPTPVYDTPAKPTYEAPPPSPPTYETNPAPKPAPEPEPEAGSGYMGVVDKWRKKLGLKALKNSAKLESNAMDTVVASNGQMVHKLNAGSFAQVLAPGKEGDKEFEYVLVGGWFCEIQTLPGLDGICKEFSHGWTYQGQTGHAEILTDDSYGEIGCALHKGIWCCDLA